MGKNSVPKFIFLLSRFPVYRGSVLGRFYCNTGISVGMVLKKSIIQRLSVFERKILKTNFGPTKEDNGNRRIKKRHRIG